MPTVQPKTRWSRGAPSRGISLAAGEAGPVVDREKRLIRGCSLIARGEALGHGFWIDSEFIDQTVADGQAAGVKGVKARFTHPGLCADGLGKYLGRWRNHRRDGDKCRADLHLAESASRAPDGDLAAYVMDLAEEDPEAFGASIVFDHDLAAEDEFWSEHQVLDEELGRMVFKSPDGDNAHNLMHARLAKLRNADVVDEPAANPDGLFGRGGDLAARAERFLDWLITGEGEAPELEPAFGVSADRAREFLMSYLDRRSVRLSATPGASGASAGKEREMAGENKPAPETKPDGAALQAEARKAGVEEGGKAVRDQFVAMLAAFPQNRPFAVECFEKGFSIEAAKLAAADKLAAEVERLRKENEDLRSQAAGKKPTGPQKPPAGPAATFSEGSAAAGNFRQVAEALAAERGLELGEAMSLVARQQPELHAKYLAGE